MLHAEGRLRISGGPQKWLDELTRRTREAPLTQEVAVLATEMNLHSDPADRFLVATAQVLDRNLVTADEKLLGLPTIKTLAIR